MRPALQLAARHEAAQAPDNIGQSGNRRGLFGLPVRIAREGGTRKRAAAKGLQY